MVILWSTTETGKVCRATDKNEIPNGAFMFSLEGTYLGVKGGEPLYRTVHYHSEPIEPKRHMLTSQSIM